MGAAVTKPFHREVLTSGQERVLGASAPAAKRWGAHLAGGTAAGLRLGHRRSVDLDWFTPKTVSPADVVKDLKALGRDVEVKQNTEGTFLGIVDGVQYSVFRYRYPLLQPAEMFDGCGLASVEDLAAMKLAAICSRSTKKDYVDLHALMTKAKMPVRKMLEAYQTKFAAPDVSAVTRALGYFADAEKEPMPIMLAKTTWSDVKRALSRAARSLELDC